MSYAETAGFERVPENPVTLHLADKPPDCCSCSRTVVRRSCNPGIQSVCWIPGFFGQPWHGRNWTSYSREIFRREKDFADRPALQRK